MSDPAKQTDNTNQGDGTQDGANNKSTEGNGGTQTGNDKSSEGTNNSSNQESGKSFSQDDVNRLLAKEKRDWEKKVKDAEEKAKLSEDERLKRERDDAVQQLRERDTRDFIIAQAEKSGVKNPRLFYSAYKSEIETDDKGNVKNFQDVLDAAKADTPELFGDADSGKNQKPQGGGADGGAGSISTTTTLTKEKIEKMSQKEINENWDEIQKFLASQK